ncbi:MAG: glucosaminidase domain-containing protein [Chloroflexaceae bacterium]|jgi:hypothetical protein|nr:glucosaminidase domain-containing protein [Chloroflexaceae bacterium]
MNDKNNSQLNSADAADLLENLLTGPIPVLRTPRPAPIIRHTGRVTASQPAVDVRVRQTGAMPVTTSKTGAMPVTTSKTGAMPVTTSKTGAMPVTTSKTGALSLAARKTGSVDVRVQRNSTTAKHGRPRNTVPLVYSDDNDLYLHATHQPSLIYTAGTNVIWVTLILILVWLGLSIAQHQETASPNVSNFNPVISAFMKPVGIAVTNLISIPSLPDTPPPARIVPSGESSVLGPPTISADRINEILRLYGSPAQGTGQAWIDAGLAYGIDPVYALAFFMHESGMGTNPMWAGIKSDGSTTHNVGNIICAGYANCYGRFRDYPDWNAGIRDWFRLISVEYIDGRGVYTVDTIIPVYAPAFENDVPGYIASVKQYVAQWQAP